MASHADGAVSAERWNGPQPDLHFAEASESAANRKNESNPSPNETKSFRTRGRKCLKLLGREIT
jgi:hypothetical protein